VLRVGVPEFRRSFQPLYGVCVRLVLRQPHALRAQDATESTNRVQFKLLEVFYEQFQALKPGAFNARFNSLQLAHLTVGRPVRSRRRCATRKHAAG
jgi:hypothetical protein